MTKYIDTNIRIPMECSVSKNGTKHIQNCYQLHLPKIRVNSISPGGIYRKQPRKFIKRYIEKTPLLKWKMNKILQMQSFFSSNMSSYITGQDLIVDRVSKLTIIMNPKSAESRLCIGTANFGLKYGINKKKPLK